MVKYTYSELTDMIMVYGAADGNANLAERLYRERFPDRTCPARTIFPRLVQRMRDTGNVTPFMADTGTSRTTRTLIVEDEVLHEVAENPQASVRSISKSVNVSYSSVWRILNEDQLYPYHLQRVQMLSPNDFRPRVTFCEWLLQRCGDDPHFLRHILFTDEAVFSRDGFQNCHNSHTWTYENPHNTCNSASQNKFTVNVWAGIINGQVVGPYVLPPYLNGELYLRFLQGTLPVLMEDIPLNIRQRMWLQQDSAPPHFSINVRNYLDATYEERWIGRSGPVPWPARSPDLTPLDFFLWGHMKTLIYETPVESKEDLVARIVAAAEKIRDTPDIFERVYANLLRRCRSCIEVGGRNFEQLL